MNDNVPLELTDGLIENNDVLLTVSTKTTVCDDSFAGPGLILVAHPAYPYHRALVVVISGPLVNVGGSLIAATLITNSV